MVSDDYDVGVWVEPDTKRYEAARRIFKEPGGPRGYQEFQLFADDRGRKWAMRILTRSDRPRSLGVWNLYEGYKRVLDALTADGFDCSLWLRDEILETSEIVDYQQAMIGARRRPGRGNAGPYYQFRWPR